MSKQLIEQIRRARQSTVTVGEWEFVVTRPTDMQIGTIKDKQTDHILREYVVGWNLKEEDVVPGGTDLPVKFEKELFFEWVADHQECWEPILGEIIASYSRHYDALEINKKK